jgi:hypothetical protein
MASALGVELAHAAVLERRLGAAGHVLTGSPTYRASEGLGLLALVLLLAPLPRWRAPGRAALGLAALATLVGGLALRWAVVMAGRRSADRPEDYFTWTRAEGRDTTAPFDAGSTPGEAGRERRP